MRAVAEATSTHSDQTETNVTLVQPSRADSFIITSSEADVQGGLRGDTGQSSSRTERRQNASGFRGGMECSSHCLLETSSRWRVPCCSVIPAEAQRRA